MCVYVCLIVEGPVLPPLGKPGYQPPFGIQLVKLDKTEAYSVLKHRLFAYKYICI